MVHEVQATGTDGRDRVSVSRFGETDMLGHGGGDSQRGGGEGAHPPAGIDAATAFGEQVGAEAEREELLQATAGISFPAEGVLGTKDVGTRVFCL